MKSIKNSKGNETLIFAQTFEYEAYEQVKKLANFEPYLDNKIRIMPDAHVGKGCTVGTTMTITDKITPALVGVDIGCFSGNTIIPLLNGTKKSLKELTEIGGNFWVYSINEDKKIIAGKAVALKTRENAQLIKVFISGGEEIICTPDHKFMLRNGEYKEAKDLKYQDSLMPFYRIYQSRDGYESILQISGIKNRPTHKIIAEQFFGEIPKGYVVHHINENKFDNTPENLQIMTISDHSKLHSINSVERFKSERFKKARIAKLQLNGFYSPELYEKKKETAIENITSYMKTDKFKEDIKDNGLRGKKYLEDYNTSEQGRFMSSLPKSFKCDICGRGLKSEKGINRHKKQEHNNHKVIKIESLDYTEDVYCLQVEKYHNFALSAGVFVHNCGMTVSILKTKELDLERLDEVINTKIPSGFNVHEFPKKSFDLSLLCCKNFVDLSRADKSIGSLGGGNHFIEIGKSESTGDLFLIIHSGSRKLGGDTCKYYQDKAFQNANEMTKVKSELITKLKAEGRSKDIDSEIKKLRKPVTDKDLAYLTGKDFYDYMHDMAIVQKYASLNRKTMAEIILKEMSIQEKDGFETIHNYIDFRKMILRKGAVSSEVGERLIIPMNMRDGSLICMGKGNPDWNYSAPHGAGRLMSRSKAKQSIDMDDFISSMEGIYTTSAMASTLDEAPQAYKPTEEIMEAIKDTVDIIDIVKPIYNFKAH